MLGFQLLDGVLRGFGRTKYIYAAVHPIANLKQVAVKLRQKPKTPHLLHSFQVAVLPLLKVLFDQPQIPLQLLGDPRIGGATSPR